MLTPFLAWSGSLICSQTDFFCACTSLLPNGAGFLVALNRQLLFASVAADAEMVKAIIAVLLLRFVWGRPVR